MKKEIVQELLIALLVLLFVYAGSSKLVNMPAFKTGMLRQPFPVWLNELLATVLPFAEVVIAAALVWNKTRTTALYTYAFLMLCFSGYTGLVVFGFFAHTPCSCGGIINELNWTGHFIINLIFLLLACLAIRLHARKKILRNQGVSPKPVKE